MRRWGLLGVLLIISSCASYRVFDNDTRRPAWTRINKSEQKGLAIAAEDYSHWKKSEKYFARDLFNMGYIPVYVCIGNSKDYEFTVQTSDIVFRYENGAEAKSVKVEEVVENAKSSPAISIPAFLFLIFPGALIWDAISEANFELDKDYTQKSFYDCHIKKDDELYGFVFFKIPEGQENTSVKDANLKIRVIKKASLEKKEAAEDLDFIVSILPE